MFFLFHQPWYKHPHDSGFFVFVYGVLFVLTVYHWLLYYQHRDKVYLLYSLYTFFIMLSQLGYVNSGFLYELIQPIEFINKPPETYTEIYYIIYVFFAFRFLDTKKEFPKAFSIIIRFLYVLLVLIFLKFIVFIITQDRSIQLTGYFVFVVIISLLSIYIYILFFKQKTSLKYYIIVGGLFLSICSYISLWQYFGYINRGVSASPAYTILYIGFILENILFALGLGHKQKNILHEKNKSQEALILQMKENDILRSKVQQQLEKEVTVLSENAKQERLLNIKLQYEKDLAELKVAALRSQMNPHFIFNSLNSIKRYIIDQEIENAVYYLNKFSKLIRQILSSSMEGNVSLKDEIETAKLYVNIENIRFNNEIDIEISIENTLNIDTITIPSLILQPFIENAIWHGLSPKKGKKKLLLKVDSYNQDFVRIVIEDNGVGRLRSKEIKSKKIHKRESVGLKITKERLENFTRKLKSKFNLSIDDLVDDKNKPFGTRITLLLPVN
jgi:sensor histidine kinase YesM